MRRPLALFLVGLMLFATAACGEDSSPGKAENADLGQKIAGLSVSGTFGDEPEVSVKRAITVDKPETQVVSEGDGDPVVADKKAILNIHLAKGSDGTKIFSSTEQGPPVQLTMQQKDLFQVVIDGLVGKSQGSRVAIGAMVKDVWGPAGAPQLKLKPTDTVLFVIDVLSVEPTDVLKGPEGADRTPPPGVPTIVEQDGEPSNLDFANASKVPPGKLQTVVLTKGDGPVVRDPSLVSIDYLGQVYDSPEPFDSSFAEGPVTFVLGQGSTLIAAWNKALVGMPQGTRVMLLVPPGDGYGPSGNPPIKVGPRDTMVFVIDILGVG